MATKTDIFAACCADEDGRYKLSKPYARCGWKCATDGRICVRAPSTETGSTEGPDMDCLPWSAEFEGELDLPMPPTIDLIPCPDCDGTGEEKCDACDGHGHSECSCECGECSHDVDCEDCRGTGKLKCGCGGEMVQPKAICVFDVGDARYALDYKYVRIICEHGVTKIQIPKKKSGPAKFIGDGFEGLVMPKNLGLDAFGLSPSIMFVLRGGKWEVATDGKSSD